MKSTSSLKSIYSTTAIDPSQLLSLCYNIKETLVKLDKGIKLAQLRLRALSYTGADGDSAASLKCSNDLVELDGVSQQLVQQLDELQGKLAGYADDPISFQIATQQLAYITSEWYDNLMPKFNASISLASEQLCLSPCPGRGKLSRASVGLSPAELRVSEALLRLKRSMEESERLILDISNNLEYTRLTIEAIFESLLATKVNLETGQKYAYESVQIHRQSHFVRLVCGGICLVLVSIVLLVALNLLGLI